MISVKYFCFITKKHMCRIFPVDHFLGKSLKLTSLEYLYCEWAERKWLPCAWRMSVNALLLLLSTGLDSTDRVCNVPEVSWEELITKWAATENHWHVFNVIQQVKSLSLLWKDNHAFNYDEYILILYIKFPITGTPAYILAAV